MLMENRKLSGRQRKRIDEAVRKARPGGRGKEPVTAQQSIPFRQMYKDGICRTDDTHYTKTVQFFDINYQLAQSEDKTAIFDSYCDFLNYFDSSVTVQLSFLNQLSDFEEFGKMIELAEQDDDFNDIRREYSEMLKNQLEKGNNGLVRTKFITFGIESKSLKEAKPKLERIEADIISNFKTMGVLAQPLNGTERLAILHRCFNPDGREKFMFSWNMLPESGLSVKDFIAPSSFDFSKGNSFRMNDKPGAVSFIQILASEMSDRMLADFLNVDHTVTMSIHLQSIDQNKAVKMIKRKITDLDKMKMEEQKKAFRNGYDIDIMPSDINTFGKEAKSLLNDLQNRNERLFMVTILIMNTADTKRKLDNIIFQEQGLAQKYNCQLKRLDFQQEDGIMACVPIGVNNIEIKRGLTTSSTAIFVPFTTQELFQEGESLYYGLNAVSNNMILCDRKQLKNPNGLILGTPGSGKSFSAKREITNAFLTTTDDIIICDPEAEYFPLVNRLGGQVIKISPTSPHFINPLDINLNYSEDENPLALKSDFVLSMCELIVGGKSGLEPIEKTIIDRCVRLVYRDYLADPEHAEMPV
ncbi:MAG: conjugal transfer protein TraE, partial [Oscillospiraceae bacterium]|nr:conjugal transfer protein TraE [Oscillospiraceae bacterium]